MEVFAWMVGNIVTSGSFVPGDEIRDV